MGRIFEGVGVALLTFFNADGTLDAKATATHAVELVERGVAAVVVGGTTGEGSSLSTDEKITLVSDIQASVGGSVPVLAGIGSPSAWQAARESALLKDSGAGGLLVLSPPRCGDLFRFYSEVCEAAGGLDVIAYHYPAISSPGIEVSELSQLPISGVKDSSDDPTRLLAEVTTYKGAIYVGSSAALPLAGALGCAGAILALANLHPERCREAFDGDMMAQRAIASDHVLVKSQSIQVLKHMVAERSGASDRMRIL